MIALPLLFTGTGTALAAPPRDCERPLDHTIAQAVALREIDRTCTLREITIGPPVGGAPAGSTSSTPVAPAPSAPAPVVAVPSAPAPSAPAPRTAVPASPPAATVAPAAPVPPATAAAPAPRSSSTPATTPTPSTAPGLVAPSTILPAVPSTAPSVVPPGTTSASPGLAPTVLPAPVLPAPGPTGLPVPGLPAPGPTGLPAPGLPTVVAPGPGVLAGAPSATPVGPAAPAAGAPAAAPAAAAPVATPILVAPGAVAAPAPGFVDPSAAPLPAGTSGLGGWAAYDAGALLGAAPPTPAVTRELTAPVPVTTTQAAPLAEPRTAAVQFGTLPTVGVVLAASIAGLAVRSATSRRARRTR